MGDPIYITECKFSYCQLSDGAPPTSIIGTEIKTHQSFKVDIVQTHGQPPIASGLIGFSDAKQGGERIGDFEFQYSGDMSPNTVTSKDVRPPWHFILSEIPPQGEMGDVTVIIKRDLLE